MRKYQTKEAKVTLKTLLSLNATVTNRDTTGFSQPCNVVIVTLTFKTILRHKKGIHFAAECCGFSSTDEQKRFVMYLDVKYFWKLILCVNYGQNSKMLFTKLITAPSA